MEHMSTSFKFIIPVLVIIGVFQNSRNMAPLSPNDPNSFSRPDLVVVKHMKFVLGADFKEKIFSGYVDLTVEKIVDSADELVLDTQELHIQSVSDKATGAALQHEQVNDEKNKVFGSKMIIKLPAGNKFVIKIDYKTSPSATGLQWLLPAQTAGKVHPYVFSQFQAIAARSFVPCQDTPSAKITYEAEISCPKELKVVMSAIPVGDPIENDSVKMYSFKQKVPVQSYLIALAIGALESRKIGPRSTVHAEKEIIEESAKEFADTETQLKTAEDICGPYVWGIYDLLVLPPSFPFGGMENPCLTFVTPTLLAGDRSLVNVIGHEIAHSWTGNLVTNVNFEHFWLNEGFTVFIERKILGRLHGEKVLDFAAYGGLTTLKDTVKQLGELNPLTSLVVKLDGVHPDDSFSSIPYEKGYVFLRYLEKLVGGPSVFEPFLRKYFDTYKYKSISTDVFKKFFLDYFAANAAVKEIDWETWLYKPGMPPVIPDYDKSILDLVTKKKEEFLNWNSERRANFPFSIDELSSEQKIQLLHEIVNSGPQPIPKLQMWEHTWNMSKVQNAEIKFAWLRIGLISKVKDIVQPALDFVNDVGRMKYTRPIYRDFYAWEEVRPQAIENFNRHKKFMMHVSAFTLEKDLHLK